MTTMKPLDEKTLLKLMNKVKNWFCKRGFPAEAEDAAQEYVVYLLEGYGRKQTIHHYCIEYLRVRSGKSCGKHYAIRRQLNSVADSTTTDVQSHFDPTKTTEDRLALMKFISQMASARSQDIMLKRLEGWSIDDIAAEYGVTWQAIHHYTKKSIAKTIDNARLRSKAIRQFLTEAML